MNQWFERLTEQIMLARDEISVESTLQRLTCEAGFSVYAYLTLHAETHTAISNYPVEWQVRYFEKSYALIDPVVLNAKTRAEAFSWSNVSTPRMSKERRVFYGEAAEFGIRSGISIPIKTGFGRMAMLTLASSDANFADEYKLNPVVAAASFGQVHSRMEALRVQPTRRTDVRLKAVELTCLRWSAEGKSMKAIAIIENTTFANVCFFLRNAKAALGATTLPQATAIAKELVACPYEVVRFQS
ncbi:autoinducer binding domain-containing protein [Pseudaminobacter soli (ex Li et al. 2025)]|uniref:Autoinducer-binding protein n=1 Tax=Pseudaminobacter soli (ex Li et al. 2025) TaxID=1295366 RepID=A0A2P7RMB7_9HYPH|nr:autoinducer binding domain-containing protein [Mesorhizobium soli]PSJ51346.1 autoinducer-binding protein [Mesorhizobium soli]